MRTWQEGGEMRPEVGVEARGCGGGMVGDSFFFFLFPHLIIQVG